MLSFFPATAAKASPGNLPSLIFGSLPMMPCERPFPALEGHQWTQADFL